MSLSRFPPGVKPDREGISLVYLDACEVVVGPTGRSRCCWSRRCPGWRRRSAPAWYGRSGRSACRTTMTRRRPICRSCGRIARTAGALRRPGVVCCVYGLAAAARDGARTGAGTGGCDGHFRGPENLLYRIEVHDGGPVGHATFKWSRENGAVLLPLTSLTATVAHLAPIARQAAAQLVPGTWMEFSDRHDRMLGRSRTMVQVVSADGVTGRIELSGSPADGQAFKPGERDDIALRRWDQRLGAGPRGGEPVGPKWGADRRRRE